MKKVFLVSAQNEERELIHYLLQKLGAFQINSFETIEQAIRVLQSEPFLDLMIVDESHGGQTLETWKSYQKRLGLYTPILYLRQVTKISFEDISPDKELRIFTLKKPLEEKSLNEKVKQILRLDGALQTHFFAVRIALLKLMDPVQVPLFIKINDLKYVKLTAEESKLDEVHRKRYEEKGITELYIEGHCVDEFIRNFKKKILARKAWNEISVAELTESTRVNIELMKALADKFGFSDGVVQLAHESVQKALALVQRNPELKIFLKHFQHIERFGFAEHVTVVALVARALLGRWLGQGKTADSSVPIGDLADFVQTLTMASLFHDLSIPDHQWSNHRKWLKLPSDKLEKNHPEVLQFLEHPKRSAAVLKDWDFATDSLLKIVENHHAYPLDRAFASTKTSSSVDPMTVVLILAEEFVFQWFESHLSLTAEEFLSNNEKLFKESPMKEFRTIFLSISTAAQ